MRGAARWLRLFVYVCDGAFAMFVVRATVVGAYRLQPFNCLQQAVTLQILTRYRAAFCGKVGRSARFDDDPTAISLNLSVLYVAMRVAAKKTLISAQNLFNSKNK